MISRLLSILLYRLLILINGPVSSDHLKDLLHKKMQSVNNFCFNLQWVAFQHELSHYVLAQDLYWMREIDDPFIGSPIIDRYKDEFIQFAEKQQYQPGGIINTELLLLYCVIRHTKPDIFIESGTKFGYSSVFIAEALNQNATDSRLYCLSQFNDDELKSASKRLEKYQFTTIVEGPSEENIDKIAALHSDKRTGILIDGPKARSENWDILTDKISRMFPDMLFICFDDVQEHVPIFSPDKSDWNSKRGINIERLKFQLLFHGKYKKKGYKMTIQSNQFCNDFYFLNEYINKQRNKSWGSSFPWGPYQVDRIKDHIALCYKLGIIYHPKCNIQTKTTR